MSRTEKTPQRAYQKLTSYFFLALSVYDGTLTTGNHETFCRALKALPGSYKLWNMYLRERRDRIRGKCITGC